MKSAYTLAISLLMAAASTEAHAQEAPFGAQTKPVQLTRLVAKLSRGERIGKYRQGVICAFGEDLLWKSGSRQELNTEEFDEVFREELEKLGFTVAGDPNNLFEDNSDNGSEYLIGGTIDKLDINVCYPMGGFGDYNKARGDASVEVNWQIYSKIDRKVVGSIRTTGYMKTKSQNGGMYTILLNAFADGVQKLAQNEKFKATFSGAPTDLSVARTAPKTLPPLTFKAPLVAATSVPGAVGATALIFAGGGHGSGFLISSDGHLLTNEHVVGAAKYVKVRWSDGKESLGEVVRTDRARDVAVVKTETAGRNPLKLRKAAATVGEDVFAIGAPLDPKLQSSVTKGIVSATRVIDGLNYIQSDVAVNSGNSGGPLIDGSGQVVGMTVLGVAKAGVPVGINLFVPIEEARAFLALEPAQE